MTSTAERAYVENPDSERIAMDLNMRHQKFCEHNRAICYLRCGVERDYGGWIWLIISRERREEWRRTVFGTGAE